MKIGKWHIRFSKFIVFMLLMYFIRLSEFVIDFTRLNGDSYSLTALIGMWGGAVTSVVGFYIWMSKNENVPWNEWKAKSQYGNVTNEYEYEEENYNDYNEGV